MRTMLGRVTLSASLWLAACNTINVMGKDIRAAGQSIEDASKKK